MGSFLHLGLFYMNSYLLCFFFSSRRRHTRFSRDWSSDVCSSDLSVNGYHPIKFTRTSYPLVTSCRNLMGWYPFTDTANLLGNGRPSANVNFGFRMLCVSRGSRSLTSSIKVIVAQPSCSVKRLPSFMR